MGTNTKNLWKLTLHIAIGGVLFTYSLAILSNSSDNISASLHWGDNKDLYLAIFNTLTPIGAFISCMFTSSLMNKYGRRLTLMISDIIMIIGCSLIIIPLTIFFGIGRFITGLSSGIFLTLMPAYINEVTPDEHIPTFAPLVQISTDLGLVIAYALGLPLPTDNYLQHFSNNWWRVILFLPAVISLYQFLFFYRQEQYESPLWLLRNGKKEQAEKAISVIYKDEVAEEGFKRFEVTRKEDTRLVGENYKETNWKSVLFELKYRKMLRIGLGLAVIQQFSGINANVIYSTYIFEELGGGDFMSKVYSTISGLVFFIASCSSIPILNKFGRKSVIILGELLLCLNMAGFGIVTYLDLDVVISFALLLMFYIVYAFTLGATLWTYVGEALNENVIGISVSTNLLVACIVTAVFPVVSENFGLYWGFFFFSGFMMASVFYTSIELIETRGKTKAEIYENLHYI